MTGAAPELWLDLGRLVVADLGDGRAACIEGNAADAVRARVRPGSDFTCIVRVVPIAPAVS